MSSKLWMKKCFTLLVMAFFVFVSVSAQQVRISGKVTDASTQETLPGVNVAIKGTSMGTSTDAYGNYSISVNRGSILLFSFLGYTPQEITIGTATTINVALVPEATELGEVVVTALGIRRAQKSLGYAVSTINAKEITKVGTTNFGSALYGKAAGVQIRTAPGGATSAVDIKIRGLNSINFSSQPLIVVDGIPIRNGEANNAGYWDDQRIRGNGLIDINPQDIEDLSILKGASASALYGSEAANGVVLITTKKGTRTQGLGVDVNYNYLVEKPAFNPPFQNIYGPGYDGGTNQGSFGSDEDGWLTVDNPKYFNENGEYVTYNGSIRRPIYRSYAQFGPAFNGEDVIGWDNRIHPYVAQPDNWNNLFQPGASSSLNVALNKAGEFGNFRFSYNRLDYKPITRGSDHQRNTFNLNSTINLHKNLKLDLTSTWVNQHTLNRPYKISRVTNNFGGFLSRFDDAQWYLDNYQTSKGYYYRTGSQESATPNENIIYNIRAVDLLDYLWRTMKWQEDEYQNRLIANATLTWKLFKDLTLRGRIANDLTTMATEMRQPNMYPLSIGESGYFGMTQSNYWITYGDLLASYDKELGENFGLIINAGFNARRETFKTVNAGTSTGLSTENWFHQNASANNSTRNGSSDYSELLKYAYFGTFSLGFRDFAFVEFTGRQEVSSTLPPGSNTFFYPSVNLSFLFSDAFHLPEAIDYGKIRVAYGIVGNAPPLYAANNAYNQGSINGIVYNRVPTDYGNDAIRPEEKHELELGLEMKMFKNRFGFEFSGYQNRIVDQILWLSVPPTVGAGRMLTNVGELKNLGLEAGIYGTPVDTRNFRWDLRFNFATNKNEVVSLMPGVDELVHANLDAGAVYIVSRPGRPMGEILAYTPKVHDNGQLIVDPVDGLYQIDMDEMKVVGNAMPKITGGLGSTIDIRNFFVDFAIDYSWGGHVTSLATQYMLGAGMFEQTLWGRDAEHDGLSYYVNTDGVKVRFDGATGPNGERVWNDGILLDGVKPDGTTNDIIVSAADYYLATHTWSVGSGFGAPYSRHDIGTVHKNNYIKFRELSVGYNLPQNLAQKLKCQNIRIALVASNLFYIYRTFKYFDPESFIGTNWVAAAQDQGSTSATRSIGFSVRASF